MNLSLLLGWKDFWTISVQCKNFFLYISFILQVFAYFVGTCVGEENKGRKNVKLERKKAKWEWGESKMKGRKRKQNYKNNKKIGKVKENKLRKKDEQKAKKTKDGKKMK